MQLIADQGAQPGARQGRPLQIGMHLIPGVPHRGVDVTQVQLIRGREHPLRHEVAAADHQLGIREVDLFNREGKQRQVLLHMAHTPRQVLDRTGSYRTTLQPAFPTTGFPIHQSRQLSSDSLRLQTCINGLNNLLSSANRAGGEPFVDEGDAPR